MPADATNTLPLRLPSLTTDTATLWLLVALELAAMVLLRNGFRRHHGG